jgi:hypothetical protein
MNPSYVDIKLFKPININGTEISTLRMREPYVSDQLAAEEIKGTSGAQEVHLFANLCEVSPDDIRNLSLKDYRQFQQTFLDFTA